MPGNEVRDRVHNFFAQDSLSQGQHHSPVVDGNLPAPGNILGVGSQRQIGGLSSNTYNLQNSDTTRGRSSYPLNLQRGLDSAQSTSWAEFSRSQQPNVNGNMYGNQYYQTRQDESSFLAVNTGSNQCNLASGGSSFLELQRGAGPEQQARGPVRSEPSGSPVSFDLFGGQQMNCQQANLLQSLQRQQPGLNEMQQLQQQVMFMKMQELQRQQQLPQLDAGPQSLLNQVPPVPKVASGNHSPASINGTTNPGGVNFALATELGNTNWLQRGSPGLQGSANGFNPTNYGQAQRLMGLIPQHIDQSLYGIPVANSRGSMGQLPQVGTEKPAVQPIPTFSASFQVNECAELSDQVSGQDGTSIHRQSLQGESFFSHSVSQALSNVINAENLQQANNMQKGSALQDLCGRLDLTIPAETSQEKAAAQAFSPQSEVGLDPTEEKILFGSDDNIWGAFSKSPNRNEEGGNLFDSAGLQGGSWSALMQSAVAVSSTSDAGPQEEWSGLNFHSAEIPSGNQNLMYNSGKHKASSAEDKLPLAPSLNSFSARPSDSTNMNNSCHNVQGHRFPYERGQNLQANSQRPVQSSDGGSKWSDFGPLQMSVAEASQIFSNTSHPLDTEMISRRGSSTLTPELGGARQLWMKPASWGVLGSAVPSGDAALSILSENSSKRLQDNNQKKFLEDEVFFGGVALKSSPRRDSAVDMEHVGSSMASPQGNSEVFSSYHSATIPSSSTTKGGEETSRSFQNNQSNYWKKADLIKSNVSEGLGFLQHHVMKDNQVLHSSPTKEFRMHEMENSDKKDNLNDSHQSNLHPHSSAGGVRENASSGASDSRCLLMGKQKLSDQGGQKNSWPLKFQYHPLGNLDEDADPRSMKQSTHSQSIVLHNPQHGQSKVFDQVSHSQTELEKGQLSNVLMDGIGSSEVYCQSRFPGGVSNTPGLFNRSLDLHSPNKVAESSRNMLQLIQKVDQSRECGSVAQFGNSEIKTSSEMPEAEDSDESVGRHLRSQSAASQGFGLQLGPPSRLAPVRKHSLTSQSPIQAVSYSHSSHAAVETGEKNQGPMRPPHQAQSVLSPSDLAPEGLKNNRFGIPGSTNNVTSPAFDSHSGFPYMGGQLKIPSVARTTAQVSTNQSMSVSFDKHASCRTEKGDSCRGSANGQSVEALPDGADTQDKPILAAGRSQLSNTNGTVESIFTNQVSSQEPVSVSQALASGIGQEGMSSKTFSSMWATFPPPKQPFGAQYGKDPSHISQSHQLNIVESSLSAPERQIDQYSNRGGNFASQMSISSVNSLVSSEGEELRVKETPSQQIPLNVDLIQKMNDSQGRESIVKHTLGGSPANSASVQRDIEAFGRSLKPNNLSNQNYSLLNQMQAIKHVEIDPSNRAFKRMKGAQSSAGAPQVPPGDTGMLGFSGPEDLQRSISSQQGRKMTPQDVLALRQDDSQSSGHSNNTNSVKPEQTQNGPQLEPSWFNQRRTLKNGQMLHMYDARRAAAMKTVEQPFTIGKSSSSLHALSPVLQVIPATSDRSPIGNLGPNSVPSSAAIEHFSSPTFPVNVGHQHLILKPMKRKRATSEHTPWHKEVSVDSRSSHTISLAEKAWARAANRLTEKVKEGIDFNEEGAPRVKAKRRAILTTQLMQQLLPPPPAAILSAEANSAYESVAYSISRSALGDACSTVCCSNGDLNMPRDDKEELPEKCNTSQRINKHYFAKAVEELMGRARRLESDFLRLDKRASVLDAMVEGQDQEKFAVINRYAKFLGRGQSDGIPQRYVTALPMPKNLPSGVHCLSL
ncbi:uncharacterized protein LOC132052364 [Lycium ferocissimum]|uniref:uncharacterized protein LOC132052364 n=1 Tax=Lycium ferocissimum TaxID=112874 RepID=UPI00281635C9|nr:uncharacterized protein LOC132052364 [Lycium ferocissimum]XP_059299854.1 uncharacterized protein LOC132052364 [Lycium ferocissimum]